MKKDFPFMVVMSVLIDRHLTQDIWEEFDLVLFLNLVPNVAEGHDSYHRRVRKTLLDGAPWLRDEEMQDAMWNLTQLLETPTGKDMPVELIKGWQSQQALRLKREIDAPITICRLSLV